MDLMILGIFVASVVFGTIFGKFFATWVLVVISILVVIFMLSTWADIRRPNSMPGTSGKLGGDILSFGMIICLALFLIAVWVTYFFTTDQSALTEMFKSIEFLRK